MTAHALKGDRERCLEAGMDAYTSKPIDAEELFAAIESVVPRPPEVASPAALDGPPTMGTWNPAAVVAAVEPTAAASGGPSIIDWAVARKAVRGDERLLDTIVETALGEIPQLLAEIRRAADAGDAHALRLAAHTLKGSIRYFGAQPVFELAVRLEAMGQGGRLEGVGEVVSFLDRSSGELMAALAEHILAGNTVTTGREGVAHPPCDSKPPPPESAWEVPASLSPPAPEVTP